VFGDGDVEPAFGVYGGGDGSLNSITIRYPDGKEHRPLSLDLIRGVPAGTVYQQVAGGGGGYGPPNARPAEVVAREVRNGVISPEVARSAYGVVVDPGTFEIEASATARLRKQGPGGSE
jgi:N-methylhydantoinase B